VRTALDGTYTKLDPKKAPPVPCRRCPDYVPQGGIWKLNLDKGIFRIFHESTGWRSIGSDVSTGAPKPAGCGRQMCHPAACKKFYKTSLAVMSTAFDGSRFQWSLGQTPWLRIKGLR
jgi:hypothetical protein